MSIFRQSFFEKYNLFYWLAVGLVLVPLVVVPSGYYPNIYYKSLTIMWLCGVLLVAWLVKFFLTNSFKLKFDLSNLGLWFKRNSLMISAFLWLVWSTAASIVGENWYRSWWGDWERSEGLMLLWLLFLATVVLIKTLDFAHWNKLIKISVNVSALISLMAYVQLMGLDLMILPDADRAGSTIGNAAFFATYALLHVGLALMVATGEKHKARWWYVIAGVLNVGGVIASGTRGALIGLIAGAVIVAGFSLFNKNLFGAVNKKIKWALAVVALLIILVLGLRFGGVIKALPAPLERISEITINSTTAQTRLEMWKYGWQAAVSKPIFGYGFENYQRVFEQFVQPIYFSLAGGEIWNTRAHNSLVDRLVDGGFVGLALYLIIFIVLLYKLLIGQNKNNTRYNVLLVATIATYVVQSLFLFDTVTSYVFFFLLIGLVTSQDEADYKMDFTSTPKKYTGYGLLVVSILLLTFVANQQWQQGVNLLSAVRAQEKFDVKKANDLYLQIFEHTTRPGQAEKILVNSLSATVSANDFTPFNKDEVKTYLKNLVNGFETYLQQDPKSAQIRFYYNRTLILLYQLEENEDTLNKLNESLKINRDLSPNNLQVIWAQAVAYMQRGDLEEAKKICQQGIELLPTEPTGYWYLSLIYFDQKNEVLGYENAGKAIDLGYSVKLFENWNKLYDYYSNKNDLAKLEKLLNSYLNENKKDVDGYFALAEVLKQEKKFNEARTTVKEILKFSPATTDLVFQEIERINYLETYGKESTSTSDTIFENVELPLN